MSSSASSGVSFDLKGRSREKGRGIPRRCRCGQGSIVRTSTTVTNPGRLFHCCPFGSKEDNSHLFKWTNESMVEEMEDVKNLVDMIQKDVGTLEKGMQACESDISHRCEKEIEELKAKVTDCEKEIQACHVEIRSFKNIIVCGLIMSVVYFVIFA